jgi:hypothetical protein
MNLRNSWLHRAVKALVPARFHPSAVLTRLVVRRTGQAVAAGPFLGMKCVAPHGGSVYYPKLLGIYERELHPAIQAINDLLPDRIVNVGAAEGYYAVGLALRNPGAAVVAFEQTPEGRALTAEMAALNGVTERVRILGRCEPVDLIPELAPARRAVVVCDVEGYEAALLDPATIPALMTAWILVELHEFVVAGIGEMIRSRFAATHCITEIKQTDRMRADYPYMPWYTRLLPRAYATYPVNEFRPTRMSWFWLEPLAPAAGI